MVNKCLFVLILLILSTSNSNAQDFSLGVKGGGSLNRMNFANFSPDYETNYGFSFGVIGNYKINQLLSFETDLLIAQKGTKYRDPNYHFSYTLDYISLPLLVKLYMPVESDFKPHLDLGPSINYLINNQKGIDRIIDPNKDYTHEYTPPTIDYTSKTRAFDFGIITGLGLDFKFFTHTVSMEAQYEFGLTNIDKGIGNGPIKNRTFSILLGYLF